MTKRARQLQQALSALVVAADRLYEHQRQAPGDFHQLARLAQATESAAKHLSPGLSRLVQLEVAGRTTEILKELAAFE